MFLVIGIATNINNEPRTSDTITSLSYLPSWLSTPSLLSVPVPRQPHALMAMDTTCNHDISFDNNTGGVGSETEDRERKGPVRINIFFFYNCLRVRSNRQFFDDFEARTRTISMMQCYLVL